jgi:hypothetical protein
MRIGAVAMPNEDEARRLHRAEPPSPARQEVFDDGSGLVDLQVGE